MTLVNTLLPTGLRGVLLTVLFKWQLPDQNYLVRSMWVILLGIAVVTIPTWLRDGPKLLWKTEVAGRDVGAFG
jgi:hypothetical protein